MTLKTKNTMKNLYVIITILFVAVACKNKQASDPLQDEKNTLTTQIVKVDSVQQSVYENNFLVKIGDLAPDFTLQLMNGETFTLSKNRGKIVMLQFTASWCGVCRKEMPFIERDIWQRHKDDNNFVLIGIDREEPLEKVKEFAKSTGITYPLALDTNANVFASYAEREAGITRNILIDKNGRIVELTRLFNETEFKKLVNKIDSLLIVK